MRWIIKPHSRLKMRFLQLSNLSLRINIMQRENVQLFVDWQPFFGQNYSEQEITLTTVLIQLISECLTLYIPLALDNLKNHEFLYYYTNKYTLLILTATPLMSQICSDI